MATKKELKEQEDLKEWLGIFKGIKEEEEAKEYIAENVYLMKVTKGLMSAYMTTYHKKEDLTWFKKAAFVKKPKTALTTVSAKNGEPIMVYSEKKGKSVPKKKRVEIIGESIETYSHKDARAAFIEKYDITVKATSFEAKEKRTEEQFDIFKGLF